MMVGFIGTIVCNALLLVLCMIYLGICIYEKFKKNNNRTTQSDSRDNGNNISNDMSTSQQLDNSVSTCINGEMENLNESAENINKNKDIENLSIDENEKKENNDINESKDENTSNINNEQPKNNVSTPEDEKKKKKENIEK